MIPGLKNICTQLLLFFQPKDAIRDKVVSPLTANAAFLELKRHNLVGNDHNSMRHVVSCCEALAREGWLTKFGALPGKDPDFGMRYVCMTNLNDDDLSYGCYDFKIFGFPSIREAFLNSVLCLAVVKENGRDDSGSAFVLENGLVVTAKHCVEKMQLIKIRTKPNAHQDLKSIKIHRNENIDLAVLDFRNNSEFELSSHAKLHEMKFWPLRLSSPQVLDRVLIMGFPQIPGFDAPCVSEEASILAMMKAIEGQVVASERAYLDQVEYLILNAKIKGGSSGSPIINEYGKVVGVTVQLPALDVESNIAGYGAALSSDFVCEIIEDGQSVPFELKEDGVCTL